VTGGANSEGTRASVPPQPGSVKASDKLRSLCDRRGWKLSFSDGEALAGMPCRELRIEAPEFGKLLDFRSRTVPVGADREEKAAADNRLAAVSLVVLVFREWGVEYPEGVTL
jgi:hypothetical protein